jgi:serine/threonine protein kinase
LELGFRVPNEDQEASPLMTTYRAYEAISQRGKGGVYRAIDLRSAPARRCVIKEGRKHGETDWDGEDGFSRLLNEKRILERLLAYGASVPNILDYFEVGQSNFLVLQSIDGEVLHAMISGDLVLSPGEVLSYGAKVADVLARIHGAGVVWRDCKPLNILVDQDHDLRAVDFEGACLLDEAPDQPWGTSGYTPPEWLDEIRSEDLQAQDLYALGATLHHMLSGEPPTSDGALPPIRPRARGIAPVLVAVVAALTDAVPGSRPSARAVAAALNSALNEPPD